MVSRVKGYLQDTEKKIAEFESSYNHYISKLPPGQQGSAIMEMNDVMTRYEANITRFKLTLDDQELNLSLIHI